ncbi:SMP-30/gluconolactonase/LRE family protein [Variovorax sp. EL159]|uniref:SMP-30/gluconolactonase/LRE family protein n=1 Tax=Variovorax sp. EL159 TaxID=1566270 RepID=UPI00088C5250|nr:SMP-30/gluconolactonase/LRE family protein [Variovorax sp. EL159]SCX65824.1 Sugar lactone lactonase YvrE [Variovorax sp. EL159]
MTTNPLRGWKVDRTLVKPVGVDLKRPECVLAEPNGDLWAADARGGVMHIRPDGSQRLIAQQADPHFDSTSDLHGRFTSGTLPNGLAFDAEGNLLIANFGTDRLESMRRDDGQCTVLLDTIDGLPIGKTNFVLRDSRNRLWITVSTRINPWTDALKPGVSDGYIILLDERGARVVADGFAFTNEVRLDAKEEWLYVVETAAKRVSRLKVAADGSLSGREVFGPPSLGAGSPDGIAFDAFGNLWVTMIMSDRLLAITPEGEVLELLDDGNPQANAALEAHAAAGTLTMEVMAKAHGTLAPWMASITFGGTDLRTVYLGSLMGNMLASFRSPVAGLPLAHWR